MADFKELFTSDDFAAYQDRVVDCVVNWLFENLFSPSADTPIQAIRCAAALSKKILDIPTTVLPAGNDIAKRLRAQVKARIANIPAQVLRKELYED